MSLRLEIVAIVSVLGVSAFGVSASDVSAFGADWPTWRYDSGRTASSPAALPEELHLKWVRQLPTARPAWPASQTKLRFDVSYQPIVQGPRMFVGSTVDDSITAYDTETGVQLWRFFTNGPVRFAPLANSGRVYATSDDGYLYCLNAGNGQLIWKFNGGPADRSMLGNGRLISSWPLRGGAVLADGVIYFAAGIWPSMGIFIHAVDADNGQTLWTNGETGSQFMVHPHNTPSFGSVVPQGYFAVAGNRLIVPGGRSLPAILDRKTGKLEHFHFGGKLSGGYEVIANHRYYFVRNEMFRLEDGKKLASVAANVLADDLIIGSNGRSQQIDVQTLQGEVQEKTLVDRRGRKRTLINFNPRKKWQLLLAAPPSARVFLKAGNRIYTAAKGRIDSFEFKRGRDSSNPQKSLWSANVEGTVWTMLAADDKLFVVTEEAKIYVFGEKAGDAKTYPLASQPLDQKSDVWAKHAASLLKREGAREGYAVAVGLGSGRLIEELVGQSQLHVIVVDPDADEVDRFRRRMQQSGLYGTRVVAHVGNLKTFKFPPYLANLIVSENAADVEKTESIRAVFQTLRPYGGVACLPVPAGQHAAFVKAVEQAALAKADVKRLGDFALLTRVGSLPDSGSWTHQYGDSANSVVSKDRLVKVPLGLLWFGGPSNDNILPRHGHGPSPQVAGGRLFLEGPDLIRALDVYTGRLLWEKQLKGLGKYYNITRHFPGAGEIGSNYVSMPDNVYVVFGSKILELDAATGKLKKEFTGDGNADNPQPNWGFATVWKDLLIATSSPVVVEPEKKLVPGNNVPGNDESDKQEPGKQKAKKIDDVLKPARYSSASRRLVVFNRHTGKQLWTRDAAYNFRHNCIAVEEGRVFCIDGMSPAKRQILKRRGINVSDKARLLALNARTGDEIWSTDEDVFGTFLNYSVEHDILLQAGSPNRDRAKDESKRGMIAYRGSNGKVLWKDLSIDYGGPCLLWRDKIITNGAGGFQLDLLTGKRTGWSYSRMYGCNTAVGSQNLLTFRSGAAGFCDLDGDSGTGNIGGFRSSCTSNLIAADGVLNAPDYTRTCECSYQNQTSLALIHMPEADLWTFNGTKLFNGANLLNEANPKNGEPFDRVGLNFGAPGDRRSTDGTLWFDYPSVGGPSPKLSVQIRPEKPKWYARHPSRISDDGLKWVAASGGKGIQSISLTLPGNSKAARSCRVRLHFAEPDNARPGERVFTVALQGEPVLKAFDIVKAAGGPQRAVVKEFKGILVRSKLEITLQQDDQSSPRAPLLCGIEVIAENKEGVPKYK